LPAFCWERQSATQSDSRAREFPADALQSSSALRRYVTGFSSVEE
jgi:hypothetical protein